MDLNQAGGGAVPGRTESFNDGMNGTPGSVASSLNDDSAVFNGQVPGKFTPHSVLAGLPGMSGNGMSEEDKERVLPGGYQMQSANGQSTESYQAARMMRLMSGREG